MPRLSLVALLFVLGSAVVRADDVVQTVDYVRQIKPLFKQRCVGCHGAVKQKNQLRLDTAELAIKGGVSGPSVTPKKSAESLLVEHLTGAGGLTRMPPEGEPLTAEQVDLIKRWIDQGAIAPAETPDADPSQHWSFVPPVRPNLPTVGGTPSSNPIDAFVAAELWKRNLQPLAEAPRNVLLRRVYLDLIGLPPTPAELQAFENDSSPNAYEKVVDQLLASPHYGERWGRHWMDVWRYSDWDGYGAEVRESQPHVWRWRDWIIESLNNDKPYSQMVQEMLAGDELAPDDPQTVRATGFLVRNWYLFNRNVWLDNTVEHTSKAFLGVTLNCARCHDHIYDPFPQTAYYQARAFFEPYDVRIDLVPGQTDPKKDGVVRVYDSKLDTPTYLFHRGEEKQPDDKHPLSPGVPEVLTLRDNPLPAIQPVSLPAASYYPGSREFEQTQVQAAAEVELAAAKTKREELVKELAAVRQRLVEAESRGEARRSPLFADDFAMARPDFWKPVAGQWEYRDGRLIQKDVSGGTSQIVAQPDLPQDFVARFKFRTTGGNQWKSVGLSFDQVDDANRDSVYVSAVSGGSKVQVAHRVNGRDEYPAAGAKALPIELNHDYELLVLVRGKQMNVALNGQLLFVYSLPRERREKGRFSLWTFDATAEFLAVSVEALDQTLTLAKSVDQGLPVEATPESIKSLIAKKEPELQLAEQQVRINEASVAFVKARSLADRAKYSQPPAPDAEALALVAGKAEREFSLQKLELQAITTEQTLARQRAAQPMNEKTQAAITDAETKLAAAKKARDEALAAVSQPTANYTPLGKVYSATSSGRRLALARWITARSNPLAARVAINHLWLRHFHQPLVPSVFDFGLNGKRPTHPELLDWLAVELMDSGWKMKPLHRLMVTSQAYRRLSGGSETNVLTLSEANSQIDPENHFLWRTNTRRLEAEIVRDCTLAVAGSLDKTPFGPDLDQTTGLAVPRRSVYFRSAKEKQMTFLALFDSANVVECYRRSESIVPQQALALANSPLAISQSRVLAGKLAQESEGSEDATFVGKAYLQVLSRPPRPEEVDACLQFLSSQAARFQTVSTLSPFSSGDQAAVKASTDPRQRARENLIHVLLNHNDFVTVR